MVILQLPIPKKNQSLQYSFIYIHQKFYACHIPTQTHWENVPAVDTTLLLARFMTFFSKWNFQWAVLKTCSVRFIWNRWVWIWQCFYYTGCIPAIRKLKCTVSDT